MLHDWRVELKRLCIVLVLSLLLGLIAGMVLPFLVAGLLLYLAWHLYQLRRLHLWLGRTAVEDDEPPESLGIWGDIFDGIYRLQRRERKATARLKGILDKAQESSAALEMAVIMLDPGGHLVWWNRAGDELLGLRSPGDRGQPITNLIREPAFLEYFDSQHYGEVLKTPSPVTRAIMLEYQITVFGEGERLMIVRNITQLHKLELMRKDFVGNVSHELRTPVTVFNGYLETMLDQRDTLATQWIAPLEQMQQQAQRMESIVRDLLLLSRLETRAVSRELAGVDVPALLQEVRSEAEALYEEREHCYLLECEEHLQLRGERAEIYSALSNLTFNAAKYCGPGSTIILRARRREELLVIEVEDNGPGIGEEHIPRLTERFYRVDDSRSQDTGGTGLGLAIVKHVLLRHGGTLEIDSKPGRGSCFRCVLPLASAGCQGQ